MNGSGTCEEATTHVGAHKHGMYTLHTKWLLQRLGDVHTIYQAIHSYDTYKYAVTDQDTLELAMIHT